jgi:hypothetical protein
MWERKKKLNAAAFVCLEVKIKNVKRLDLKKEMNCLKVFCNKIFITIESNTKKNCSRFFAFYTKKKCWIKKNTQKNANAKMAVIFSFKKRAKLIFVSTFLLRSIIETGFFHVWRRQKKEKTKNFFSSKKS